MSDERDYKLLKTNLCNNSKSSADVKQEEITQIFEEYFSNIQPLARGNYNQLLVVHILVNSWDNPVLTEDRVRSYIWPRNETQPFGCQFWI